jgi:hypothetical protein
VIVYVDGFGWGTICDDIPVNDPYFNTIVEKTFGLHNCELNYRFNL